MLPKIEVLFFLVGLALCQNTTTRPGSYCRTQPRSGTALLTSFRIIRLFSDCFLGTCPSGFECIGNKCCSEADVVQPGGDCTDYLSDCSNIECNAIGMQDFARANCARTCNMCYSSASVSPRVFKFNFPEISPFFRIRLFRSSHRLR